MDITVISFFGKCDNGDQIMDIELHPKRIGKFKPFSLEKYHTVIDRINKEFPELDQLERLSKIDELLFENENE